MSFTYVAILAALVGAASLAKSQPDAAGRPSVSRALPAMLNRDPRAIGPEKPKEQFLIELADQTIQNQKKNAMVGYWVGAFGKNMINIALADIKDGRAAGHSVCAGNYRSLTGTAARRGDAWAFVLREPGDDPHDGEFRFTIDSQNKVLQGTWTPYKKQGNSPRTYSLKKRLFVYNQDVGEFPSASQEFLEEETLANMLPEALEFMRNEIYARHGYSFKNKTMRYYFEAKDWYMPMSVDIRDDLSEAEAANIALIYRYEKYYKEKYDDYGR